MKRLLKVLWVATVLLLVSCASHPKRVDCERHLKAINAPAEPAGTRP